MSEHSFPVPVWDTATGTWLPVDFRQGQRVVCWPEGFDPSVLPQPDYTDGDHVQFVRDETCARAGVVRLVLFQWGSESWNNLQNMPGSSNQILYIITARGHDHRVKADQILGRFISLDRLSLRTSG